MSGFLAGPQDPPHPGWNFFGGLNLVPEKVPGSRDGKVPAKEQWCLMSATVKEAF